MEQRPIEIKKHTSFRVMDCPKCYGKHGIILDDLDTSDWKEAFEYADFIREDVDKILNISEGENDGDAWIAIFKLKNGKFSGLNAWCDYTGWD